MAVLKKGDTGRDVTHLQGLLGAAGFPVVNDGWFGDATEAAVLRAQINFGLFPDGIAGPQTVTAIAIGRRDPRHMTFAAIERAAADLDVPLSHILAIAQIESAGDGFLTDGRPKILYERHVMYRRLAETELDADVLADSYPALVNPRRGGYMGKVFEHGRLKSARMIHDLCALESCSWGAFQIMGYHWQALGYDSVQHFCLCMQKDEDAHLDALVRFIRIDPKLHAALKAGKWPTVARLYNGPAYAEHGYDTRLASAARRFAAIEATA